MSSQTWAPEDQGAESARAEGAVDVEVQLLEVALGVHEQAEAQRGPRPAGQRDERAERRPEAAAARVVAPPRRVAVVERRVLDGVAARHDLPADGPLAPAEGVARVSRLEAGREHLADAALGQRVDERDAGAVVGAEVLGAGIAVVAVRVLDAAKGRGGAALGGTGVPRAGVPVLAVAVGPAAAGRPDVLAEGAVGRAAIGGALVAVVTGLVAVTAVRHGGVDAARERRAMVVGAGIPVVAVDRGAAGAAPLGAGLALGTKIPVVAGRPVVAGSERAAPVLAAADLLALCVLEEPGAVLVRLAGRHPIVRQLRAEVSRRELGLAELGAQVDRGQVPLLRREDDIGGRDVVEDVEGRQIR